MSQKKDIDSGKKNNTFSQSKMEKMTQRNKKKNYTKINLFAHVNLNNIINLNLNAFTFIYL